MKTAHLLFIPACLLLTLSAGEQKQVFSRATIEFSPGASNLEPGVMDQLDAVYDDLPEGWRVELKVVAEHEIRNDYFNACRLSRKRCEAVITHLASLGIEEYDLSVHQYREHILQRTVSVGASGSYDWNYIHSLSFTKAPKLPLMFTNTPLRTGSSCHRTGLDNSRPQVVFHPAGAELHIPPFAFEHYSGYDPDCPRIDLEFCYFYDKPSMIGADLTTNNETRMLETGGMVRIRATCSDGELRLKDGIEIQVVLPRSPETVGDMSLFHGYEKYGIVNWIRTGEGRLDQFTEGDLDWEEEGEVTEEMFSRLDQFVITSGKLGWLNVDRFYDVQRPERLAVRLGEQKKNISVRMVFQDIQSVLPGFYYNPDSLVMFEGIPSGERVTVLAYGEVDGQVYFASQRLSIGEARLIELDVRPVSRNELGESIASL